MLSIRTTPWFPTAQISSALILCLFFEFTEGCILDVGKTSQRPADAGRGRRILSRYDHADWFERSKHALGINSHTWCRPSWNHKEGSSGHSRFQHLADRRTCYVWTWLLAHFTCRCMCKVSHRFGEVPCFAIVSWACDVSTATQASLIEG